MLGNDKLIKSSRFVVRIGIAINRFFLGAVVLGLIVSWIWPTLFAELLIRQTPRTDVMWTLIGMRWMLLLGIAMSVAIDRLFAALAQIIESAGAGDPFIAANARRLQTIGWALVALQLLDIPGALIGRFFPALSSGTPDIPCSPGGWMAVLMVFVLSRVFAAGSAMRDDLAGTV